MKNLNNDAPLGFGYVSFVHHEDAVKAVETMNGFEVDGNAIECSRFKTKSERIIERMRIRDIHKKKKINEYLGRNLYVKNLEDNVTEELLKKEFEAFGKVTSVHIETNENGSPKGFGYVCFATKEEAANAITQCAKSKILEGCTKPLYVNLHEPKENRIQRIISRPKKNFGYNPYQNPVLVSLPWSGGYGYGNQRPPQKSMEHRPNNNPIGGGRGGPRNNQPNNNSNSNNSNMPRIKPPKVMTDSDRQSQGNVIYSKLLSLGIEDDSNLLISFVGAVISSPDFNFAQAETFLKDDKFLLATLENFKGLLSQKQN